MAVRLEEVETNAVVGSKRIISKLEVRIRDLELELEEEKRRHAETIKILRKKERTVKEAMVQVEEDQKNIILLQESLEKATSKVNMYKRQLSEVVSSIFFSYLFINIGVVILCVSFLYIYAKVWGYFNFFVFWKDF